LVNDSRIVDEHEEVLDLHLLCLNVKLLEQLESHDLLFNVLHITLLLIRPSHLSQLLPVVDVLELLVVESIAIHLELLLDLVGETDKLQTELRYYWVDIDIIEESISDSLLRRISID